MGYFRPLPVIFPLRPPSSPPRVPSFATVTVGQGSGHVGCGYQGPYPLGGTRRRGGSANGCSVQCIDCTTLRIEDVSVWISLRQRSIAGSPRGVFPSEHRSRTTIRMSPEGARFPSSVSGRSVATSFRKRFPKEDYVSGTDIPMTIVSGTV